LVFSLKTYRCSIYARCKYTTIQVDFGGSFISIAFSRLSFLVVLLLLCTFFSRTSVLPLEQYIHVRSRGSIQQMVIVANKAEKRSISH
jgi:hypothetical protein